MARISVAFSGSGFKFPAHVGALKAITESDHDLVEVAGSSGGALVAAMWAADISPDTIEHIALCDKFQRFTSLEFSALRRGCINSGSSLLKFCEESTDKALFSEISKNIRITAFDLISERTKVLDRECTPYMSLGQAVRASVSIPFLFAPFEWGAYRLVDGVIGNSLPVNLLDDEDSVKIGFKIVHGVSSKSSLISKVLNSLIDHKEEWIYDTLEATKILTIETSYTKGLNPYITQKDRERLFHHGYESMSEFLQGIPR